MDQARWNEVDDYVTEQIVGEDEPLRLAREQSAQEGLPDIQVTPAQGKLLHLLARIHKARRVLELGTLGGYSTIWLARALPEGGRVVTLELDPHYAQVAGANIERAGVGSVVEQRVGPALDSLAALREEGAEAFDLVFIDADKPRTPEYFAHALALTRRGGVIVTDNAVRGGELAVADTRDAGAQGMRRFHELLAAEPRAQATTIQTVGAKGYDGFTLVVLD